MSRLRNGRRLGRECENRKCDGDGGGDRQAEKLQDKRYYKHTGYAGGIKETSPQKILEGRFPERVLEKAVERMLPKESPLARKQMTHLRLFSGSQHDHEAQQPETIDFKSASPKNTRSV